MKKIMTEANFLPRYSGVFMMIKNTKRKAVKNK